MRKEFRHGPLGVYDFDKDDEIEIELEGIDWRSAMYLDRPTATKLRDWLTEQIERTNKFVSKHKLVEMIEEAIKAEREACAKVVEGDLPRASAMCNSIVVAEQIRTRK